MKCTERPELKKKTGAWTSCRCGMLVKEGEAHPEPTTLNPDHDLRELEVINSFGADAVANFVLSLATPVSPLTTGLFPLDCQYAHSLTRIVPVFKKPGALTHLRDMLSEEIVHAWKFMAQVTDHGNVEINAVLLSALTYEEKREQWLDDMNWCPATIEDARFGLMGTYKNIPVYTDAFRPAGERINLDLSLNTDRIHQDMEVQCSDEDNRIATSVKIHLGCDSDSIKQGIPADWK